METKTVTTTEGQSLTTTYADPRAVTVATTEEGTGIVYADTDAPPFGGVTLTMESVLEACNAIRKKFGEWVATEVHVSEGVFSTLLGKAVYKSDGLDAPVVGIRVYLEPRLSDEGSYVVEENTETGEKRNVKLYGRKA